MCRPTIRAERNERFTRSLSILWTYCENRSPRAPGRYRSRFCICRPTIRAERNERFTRSLSILWTHCENRGPRAPGRYRSRFCICRPTIRAEAGADTAQCRRGGLVMSLPVKLQDVIDALEASDEEL